MNAVLLAVYFLAGIYGLYQGFSFKQKQWDTIYLFCEDREQALKEMKKDFYADTSTAQGKEAYAKVTRAILANWHTALPAYKAPATAAIYSIGQGDVFPYYYTVKNESFFMQLFKQGEITDPLRALAGHFDVAFWIIYLLPLLIIVMNFNTLSSELDNGNWKMMSSQGISAKKWILSKLWLTAVFVIAMLLIVFFTGAGFNLYYFDQLPGVTDILFCISASIYLFFWCALMYLISAFGRSSRSNALVSGLAWIAVCIILPTLVSSVIEKSISVDNTIVSRMSRRPQGDRFDDTTFGKNTIDRFAALQPALKQASISPGDPAFQFAVYMSYHALLDDSNKVFVQEYFDRIERRQRIVNAAGILNPAASTDGLFSAFSGNDAAANHDFIWQTMRFQNNLHEAFFPPIFSNQTLTLADYERFPVFHYRYPPVIPLDVLGNFLSLLILGLMSMYLARRRLSKYIIAVFFLCVMNSGHLEAQEPIDSLQKKVDSLAEVVVTSKKQLIQIDRGKIIMNVQNSALTSGSSALDLVRKLPGVSVGQEDELSLRGSSGINVMIDGKMTYLAGKQLSTLLKGMNAENVVKLELITAPGSEYDAQGNAGVINIVTKRKTNKGYAMDIRSSITRGRHWMINENITGSINTGRIDIYGSLDYNTPHRFLKGNSSSTVIEEGRSNILRRYRENAYKIKFYTYKIGADWQIAPRHELTVNYHGYFDDFTSSSQSTQSKYIDDNTLNAITRTQNALIEPYHYDAANVGYRLLFDSSGKQIMVEGHYISYRNLSDGILSSNHFDADNNPVGKHHALRSHQPGFVKIRSGKADAQLPFRRFTLKTGLKYAIVTNDNDYRFDSLTNDGYIKAETLSDYFKYEERIAAAYLSASGKIGNTTIDGGLRIEHTDADGYTMKEAFANRWRYTRIFPSLSVDQQFDRDNKINFSITRRIDRPAYSNLNPVRWYTDQYFYFSGNPDLVPEMAWVFSAAYTLRQKYVFTAGYRRSNNFLTRQLLVDDLGVVKSQIANFKDMKRFDFVITVPYTIAQFWSMQVSVATNHVTYPVSQKIGYSTIRQWAGNIQLNQQVELPAGIGMELTASYYSDDVYGIYKMGDYCLVDAGFKKSLFRDKLDIHFTLTDILFTNRYVGISQSDLSDYRYYDVRDSRRVALSLRYHLGGKLLNRRDSRIEEQDRL